MEERNLLSRAYLETLSTSDLVRLGDDFGVDIPLALNRHLIIGELLEMQEDFRSNRAASLDYGESDVDNESSAPVSSYNETKVSILLRNPGWIFAFWDFNVEEFLACMRKKGFESFCLRVSFFDDASLAVPRDTFSTAVPSTDRKRYIYIPEQGCFCRTDLIVMNRYERDIVLAHSNAIGLPPAAGIEPKGTDDGTPPLLLLSGIEELKRKYRRCHRQSFF